MNTRTALAALVALAAFGFAPEPDPTFSDPSNITNVFAAFRPGAVKVFKGRSEGARTTVLEHHLQETRTFIYAGGSVECAILEESAFEDGNATAEDVDRARKESMFQSNYTKKTMDLAYQRKALEAKNEENKSLLDEGLELLLVPQFTLAAETRKGTRPSFTKAAPPELGRKHFAGLIGACAERAVAVKSGEFGANMQVQLINDGPVTFWLQTA